MAPYNAEKEREKLWYLKYTDPQLSRALASGPPPGVHPMPFQTFEPVYLLFVKSLGGTPNLRFSIKPAPIPLHIHSAHFVVWNFGGFKQVEKTGRWPLVTKQLGLNYNNLEPTLASCHSLANAFKSNGLAQFEAWYTLSIWAGKFASVNGIEIPHQIPRPDEYDLFEDMVPTWCNAEAVEVKKPDTSTALAELLKTLMIRVPLPPSFHWSYNNLGDQGDPWFPSFVEMTKVLYEMNLPTAQVQTILDMTLSTSEELRDLGIPDTTIRFVREHEATIQELRRRLDAQVVASTVSAPGPSGTSADPAPPSVA